MEHFQPEEKRCHVVYNGIDFSKFDGDFEIPDFLKIIDSPKAESDRPHSNVGSHQSRIRLAMIGNFVRGRSQKSLLRCIYRLAEQGIRNYDFFFIGKRADSEPWRYDECVKYTQENYLTDIVHFIGGRGDVPAILRYIDGFVYSTEHDTFGIAVVEAMAAGVPVVTNDWEVMCEVTHNGKWATLYKTGDEQAGAEAIRHLINSLNERKQQAKEIAVAVREEYSIERHIGRLYEIYQTII